MSEVQCEFVQWENTPENKGRQVFLEDRTKMVRVRVLGIHNNKVAFISREDKPDTAEAVGLGWLKILKAKEKAKPDIDFRKIRFNDLFIRPQGTRIVCTVLVRGEDHLLYASSAGELREVFSRDIHNFELAFNCQGPWMDFETMKNNPHFYA